MSKWAHISHERGGAPWRVVLCGRGREWVGEGDGGGEGMSEEQTKTKCDGTDVRFKLRSPSKIMFNIASY